MRVDAAVGQQRQRAPLHAQPLEQLARLLHRQLLGSVGGGGGLGQQGGVAVVSVQQVPKEIQSETGQRKGPTAMPATLPSARTDAPQC